MASGGGRECSLNTMAYYFSQGNCPFQQSRCIFSDSIWAKSRSVETKWSVCQVNKEARRLVKRLKRHQHDLFTFLLEHEVPFENNFAERIIRQAVIMRKNSCCNRSDRGARTQAILMSVFTTLKQRNLNPIKTVEKALRIYIATGELPSLADLSASDR